VAQSIEHLLCKCEALNSNPRTTKKIKELKEKSQTGSKYLQII
jgi:hypothetical protein